MDIWASLKTFGHHLTGENGTGGTRHLCGKRVHTRASNTDDTHAFPQTTLSVVSKAGVVASLARHVLVTEKKAYPPLGPLPHLKVPATSGLVWIVVFVITTMMNNAHDDFLNKRFQWLRAIPEPRSTTVMVENIPPNFRSDEALFKYFQHVFAEGAFEVRSAYLVRRTDNLRERLEILSEIQYRKKLMHSAGQAFPGEMQEAEEWAIEEATSGQRQQSSSNSDAQESKKNVLVVLKTF